MQPTQNLIIMFFVYENHKGGVMWKFKFLFNSKGENFLNLIKF